MKVIEEELKLHGKYICKTEGRSMEPMLKQGRDRVVIVPPVFPLKKYDIPLYKRDSGQYVLHRIINITAILLLSQLQSVQER